MSAIAVFTVVSGCQPTLIRTSSDDAIMPLRVGNWWKARVTQFGGSHNEKPRLTVESEETRIVADTIVDSKHWFIINDSTMLAYTSDGVQGTFHDSYWRHQYILRVPHRIDDTVRADINTRNSDGWQSSIYSVVRKFDTIISVPAGAFRCWMVSGGGDIGPAGGYRSITAFYTGGIGKIKEEMIESSIIHSFHVTWELAEYELH